MNIMDNNLRDVEQLIMESDFDPAGGNPEKSLKADVMENYVEQLLSVIDLRQLKPYKVVANTVNATAGPVINALEKKLPFDVVKVHNVFDRSFPNGVPDSTNPAMREYTAAAVRGQEADMGVLWDLDFGRCCLFDENGGVIEGECGTRGMLVWILVLALLSKSSCRTVSELLPDHSFELEKLVERLKQLSK